MIREEQTTHLLELQMTHLHCWEHIVVFFQEYTMSNSDNFFYDDVYIGDEIIDVAPPLLISVTAISATQVDVLFNEALDQTTSENIANYTLLPALGINTATLDGGNTALVHLDLATAMTNGQTYNLETSNIEDFEWKSISFGRHELYVFGC